MAQLFNRSTNTLSRVSIYGAAFLVLGMGWVFAKVDRSSYSTREGVVLKQPIPFSHEHHVAGLGIDCRYCHTSVEKTAFAGLPPTATCMNCHKEIWKTSPMLEPVRESFRTGERIEWTRVNDLPDYVYFNHSIHVAKGIGCASCHGRIDRMPLTAQARSLQMEWCLDCHRHPEENVRPKEAVFDMAWQPPADRAAREELGRELVRKNGVRSLISCDTCHR